MTRTQTATGALDINRLKTRLAQLRADRSSFIVDNAGVVAQATNALMQYNQILSSLDGRIAELEGFLNEEQKRSDDGDE